MPGEGLHVPASPRVAKGHYLSIVAQQHHRAVAREASVIRESGGIGVGVGSPAAFAQHEGFAAAPDHDVVTNRERGLAVFRQIDSPDVCGIGQFTDNLAAEQVYQPGTDQGNARVSRRDGHWLLRTALYRIGPKRRWTVCVEVVAPGNVGKECRSLLRDKSIKGLGVLRTGLGEKPLRRQAVALPDNGLGGAELLEPRLFLCFKRLCLGNRPLCIGFPLVFLGQRLLGQCFCPLDTGFIALAHGHDRESAQRQRQHGRPGT